MTSDPTTAGWRLYVEYLLYLTPDLGTRVDDPTVDRIVEAVLAQRILIGTAATYHDAATAALASGEQVARWPGQDEGVVRDVLTRVVQGLDARRPWPVHPYSVIGTEEWDTVSTAAVIGRIPQSRMILERRLPPFASVGPAEPAVLLLDLRTGQRVALRATGAFTAPGVELLADADPAATRADFTELTGVPVDPA